MRQYYGYVKIVIDEPINVVTLLLIRRWLAPQLYTYCSDSGPEELWLKYLLTVNQVNGEDESVMVVQRWFHLSDCEFSGPVIN